ncbi:MAG: hypothetical protein Q4E78_05675 [Eubacteriales bacterium]|nr:hypothetical protein [Eubacteriales bacterium]
MFQHNKTIEKKDIAQENYEHLRKEQKKIIARMIVIILAVIAVVVALCIAWFVNNTRVQSKGMTISTDAGIVELRTSGGAGIHDDVLKKIMDSGQTNKSFWYELADKVNGFFETSSDKYAINWLLSDDSNMGNYSTEQPDWEQYWENAQSGAERQDEAIEPGSSGRLTFYVVPKYNGTVELNMNLSLIPYKLENNEFKEITEDDETDKVAKDFVDGHIIFCLEKETDTSADTKEIQWIKDGTFDIKIENAEKDKEYEYTLYWCWPHSFGEAVLKAEDSYLSGRDILFSEYKNGETVRNTILQTDELSMVKKPGQYFYSSLTKKPLDAEQKELREIAGMYNNSPADFSDAAKNAYVELSSYYNQADQYIGSHVDCIRIQLAAQPVEGK